MSENRHAPEKVVERCGEAIVDEITNRRGLRQEFDNIDVDVQAECQTAFGTAALHALKLGSHFTLADGTEAVVVPVEPTQEMLNKGGAHTLKGNAGDAWYVWRAMLAALEGGGDG